MGLTPTISTLDGDGSDEQSRQDRRLALAHRLLRVGWAMMFGLTGTARVGKLLELCNHDMSTLNFCNTTLWTAGNVSIALVSPLIGAMSDGTTSRMGRRRPYIVVGQLGACAALWGMMTARGYWTLAICHGLYGLGNTISCTAYRPPRPPRTALRRRPPSPRLQTDFGQPFCMGEENLVT